MRPSRDMKHRILSNPLVSMLYYTSVEFFQPHIVRRDDSEVITFECDKSNVTKIVAF